MIIDWIAQAQLYVCLREEGFRKARAQQIGDIHKFVSVLSNSDAASDLCTELGLKPTYVAPLLASLNKSPSFVRLREIQEALLPDPAAQNKTPVVAAPSAPPLRPIETTSATPSEPHDPAGVRAAESEECVR